MLQHASSRSPPENARGVLQDSHNSFSAIRCRIGQVDTSRGNKARTLGCFGRVIAKLCMLDPAAVKNCFHSRPGSPGVRD